MKNKFAISILSLILLLFIPNTANAQFGKLLKKAKKKVEKTIKSDKTKKTTKPTKTEEAPTQEEAPVEQKTEVVKPAPVPKKNNLKQKGTINKDHEELVRYFLIATKGFTTAESYSNHREPSYYTKINGTNLKDAIYIINTEEFKDSRLLRDYYKNLKSPKYSEIRYALTDQLYKNEIVDREMYPNKDRSDISKRPLQIQYELFKFIGDYMLKNNPDILAETAYVKKKIDKINAKFEAKLNAVVINDMHKANLYKVVFTSNKNINPQTAPASAYKTTFKPGEEIFAVAMVDKPLNKKIIKGAYPNLFMTTSFNDYIQTVVEYDMFRIKPNQKYFVFPIVVKSSNFKCSNTEATANTEYAMRWLSKKEDRRFKIKVQLKEGNDYHNSSGSLEGTFTYDASDIGGAVLRKMANQVATKCGRE